MNNIITLIKANIINSWGINKILKSKSKGEKIRALLLGIVIVYAFCMLILSMFLINMPLAQGLEQLNALDVLLSSSILSVTLISLILCIFKLPSYLFAFKDFDLLMSLPVKPSEVLTSKMIFIYFSNLVMTVMISVPSLIIYGYKTSAETLYYIFVVIITLFTPLIPISIGALFAYILGRSSSRLKATNAVMIIGSLLLCVLVIIVSPMISQIKAEQIRGALPAVGAVNSVLFWNKFYIGALKNTDIISLLVFIVISLTAFSVFVGVLSKGFKTANGIMAEKYRAADYKMTRLKVSSPLKALYMKELQFYFSSFIYVTNTAMGAVMMTIFSLGITIFGKEAVAKIMEIPMTERYISSIVTIVFVFCISLTFITAPSISLEGKSLWIIKSLPVEVKSILWSKVLLNLTITVPALLINTIIVEIGYKFDLPTVGAILAVSLMYCIFAAVTGLLINLNFPKLEWTTHMAVVKQSASVLLNMLVSFISIIIPVVIFMLVRPGNQNMFLWFVCIIVMVCSLVLIKILNTAGVKKFQKL